MVSLISSELMCPFSMSCPPRSLTTPTRFSLAFNSCKEQTTLCYKPVKKILKQIKFAEKGFLEIQSFHENKETWFISLRIRLFESKSQWGGKRKNPQLLSSPSLPSP